MSSNQRNPAPYLAPPAQFQRGPLVKPIDSCWRGTYETGKGGNFNTPNLPTAGFEAQANVAFQPCWLTFLHAALLLGGDERYVCLFDLNPGDPQQLALVVPGAVARYTFGPVPAGQGGTIIYEASAELIPVPFQGAPQGGPEKPWAYGLPFNFGIVAVASSTPRVYTQTAIPASMGLTCRVQT